MKSGLAQTIKNHLKTAESTILEPSLKYWHFAKALTVIM